MRDFCRKLWLVGILVVFLLTVAPRSAVAATGIVPTQSWGSFSNFNFSNSFSNSRILGFLPNNSSGLPSGNAITDGKAILRYALPINNPPIRQVQGSLEDIANQLRGKRWKPVAQDVSKAERVLSDRTSQILAAIPEAQKAAAEDLIAGLQTGLTTIRQAIEVKDAEQVWTQRRQLLDQVGTIEEMMVTGFPFTVPAEYSHLPQLKGRATINLTTTKGKITLVVDGYSAPVTAGNFVDLVQRGFYDGLEITSAEESFTVQAGDPPGEAAGFIDPDTKEYRSIPLEILAAGDSEPTYGITLEDAGRYRDLPALPFSAYGAVVMGHPEFDANGGSSQFFFFLFEPELTPAGRNLLDGRYAVFGYLTEGKEVLASLRAGDTIESAQVIKGLENLVVPSA
ncbi:MAG: peptidylprolyl isomerase [Coleofasciculaceae cyanobacterium SM2_1_6]|nr:peptidylprolyl isomerase [Coleofasciculaceae cyanobacterium SM2_1_6]